MSKVHECQGFRQGFGLKINKIELVLERISYGNEVFTPFESKH